MNKDTFGDSRRYCMLEYLTEQVLELPSSKRSYLSSFLRDFNITINNTKSIRNSVKDDKYRNYIRLLIKKDYYARIDSLSDRYDNKLLSYIKNYVNARLKEEVR